MSYKNFTPAQRATVKALADQMRMQAPLHIGDKSNWAFGDQTKFVSKEGWVFRVADDWDQEGSYQPARAYIKDMRYSLKAVSRTQADVFAEIKGLGLLIRKTDAGDYRLAPQLTGFTKEALDRQELRACYCADLAEALATAYEIAEAEAASRDYEAQREELRAFAPRASEILAAKYPEGYDERESMLSDPLAYIELIAEHVTAEIGLLVNGNGSRIRAGECEIEAAKALVAQRPYMAALEARGVLADPPAVIFIDPAPEAAPADMIEAAKAALFALDCCINLQGLTALTPVAAQLRAALQGAAQ